MRKIRVHKILFTLTALIINSNSPIAYLIHLHKQMLQRVNLHNKLVQELLAK